jgi:hypothetical protein
MEMPVLVTGTRLESSGKVGDFKCLGIKMRDKTTGVKQLFEL